MSDTILTINVDKAGREFFITHKEKIVIVKPHGAFFVCCTAFQPFGDVNTVEFKAVSGYAGAGAKLCAMERIKIQDSMKTEPGQICLLKDSGFSRVEQSGVENKYGISNQRSVNASTIVGLSQEISINGGVPELCIINGQVLPKYQRVFFDPLQLIWIMAAKDIEANMVIPSKMLFTPPSIKRSPPEIVIGDYLEVNLNEFNEIRFDNDTNSFRRD